MRGRSGVRPVRAVGVERVGEQAGVRGRRPAGGAVVEVGGQAFADRGDEHDDVIVDSEAAAVDVGQFQQAQLS